MLATETNPGSSYAAAQGFTKWDLSLLALLFATLAFLCGFTWLRWGALPVDCGREMYVPFAINSGQRLYFDIWYPYGPLVPYWHAVLFRVFGTHLWVLYTVGITLVGVMAVVLYAISRTCLPPVLSFAAVFTFLFQAFQIGIFNYVLPYSYPATYGSVFTAVLVLLLLRDLATPSHRKLFFAGVLAGALALTKIEFGVAAFCIVGVAVVLRFARERSGVSLIHNILLITPGAMLCAAVYGAIVARSSIRFLFDVNIAILPDSFFLRTIPHWVTMPSLKSVVFSTVVAIGSGVFIVGVLVFSSYSRRTRLLVVFIASAATVACIGFQIFEWRLPGMWRIPSQVIPLLFFNPGFRYVGALLGLIGAIRYIMRGAQLADGVLAVLGISGIVIAFRISEIQIQPRGYSIFYTPVAYIAWLVAIYTVANGFALHIGRMEWRLFAASVCLAIISLTSHLHRPELRPSTLAFERGTIRTDSGSANVFREVVPFVRNAAAHSQRVVVWPEELAIYYFSDTLAPSRWTILTPGILPTTEQHNYTAELDRKRVNYVVLTNRVTPEYRMTVFGADYNQEVYRWLQDNFHVIREAGIYDRTALPEKAGTISGAVIWERNSPKRATTTGQRGATDRIIGQPPTITTRPPPAVDQPLIRLIGKPGG